MVIEFDFTLDEQRQRRTNLHPHVSILNMFEINQTAEIIKVTVKKAAASSIKLMTSDGDFLDYDETQVKNNQLSVSFHKVESATGGTRTRVGLLGEFFLEVRKVMNRQEEKFTFKVTVLKR